ncbi:hypothetical protein [Flavobacterium suncheonense]|uniref:hypothetical protein n=1 Tax=Flavobacterium suncheonense TaxID=350894 RepID=UPI0010401098|nr:hypothetical protein [Flavobacterium suncheonense]
MKQIFAEIGKEFINVILGNVYSKTGLSLMLLLIGLICIFAPIGNEEQKPKWFYIVGSVLTIISILLIVRRYFELKKKN